MKVLHVVESLERGGLERVVVDLCIGQQRQGMAVGVLCLYTIGRLAEELQAKGISVDCVAKRHGLDLRHLRTVRRYLDNSSPDVVHTHNAAAGYLAAIAGITLDNAIWINTRHGMGAGARWSRKEWLFRLAARRYRHIAAVCEAAAVRYRLLGNTVASRLCVVTNGIRTEAITTQVSASREQLRKESGCPSDAFLIGTVGRLNPVKNQDLLIRALPAVLSQVPTARLAIVGDGPSRAHLVGVARDCGVTSRVHFAGDRSDVPNWLTAFDAFALPSRSEGYSLALLEASTAGAAIVCTDVGGNSEIVRHRQTGLLIPPESLTELAAALVAVATDIGLQQRLRTNARRWASQNADVAVMVQKYTKLYAGA